LVGRDGEVRALLRHWRASRAGSGTAVAVSGDGGMGKTRLTSEILGAAAADGALTATAMAGGPGAAAPFALWSELIDDLMAQAALPQSGGDWDTPLAAVRAGTTAPATELGLDRVRFFEATVALLSRAARDRPLALALEDLHAADRSSLELVAYVGRRITRKPVLLVLTRRRLPPRPELDAYRAALDFLGRGRGRDPLILAESLAGMAWAQAVAGDPGEADKLLTEAELLLSEIREAGDAAGKVSRLSHDLDVARAHVLLRAGRFTDSYGPLIAASAAAGRAGRADLAYSCLANAASAAACAGDLPRALDFADRCLPLVVPSGLLRLCVYTHSARAALLRLLDRPGEARVACDAAAAFAERIGLPQLEGLVHYDRGLLAASVGDHEGAASELGLALDLGAPVSRPLARLLRSEALARNGRSDDAERELRAVALEPVSPADLPDTLVARMAHVQGLIALQRGNQKLAVRRLREAESGWLRRSQQGRADYDSDAGQGYVASLIDLGRPPVTALIEPARELASLRADIATTGVPDA
jgi:tetratricopeptide (TPR) repeat protein